MRAHIRTGLVLALSVGMLAWLLRGANLREVWGEIQNGRVGLLAHGLGRGVQRHREVHAQAARAQLLDAGHHAGHEHATHRD